MLAVKLGFLPPAMGLTLTKKCRSFRVLTCTSETGAGVGGGFLSFLSKEVKEILLREIGCLRLQPYKQKSLRQNKLGKLSPRYYGLLSDFEKGW